MTIKTLLHDFDSAIYATGYAAAGEPLPFVLATIKSGIEKVREQFPDVEEHKIFISGKGNFRDTLATIQPYKGNRDPSKRPEFYDEMRQYVIDYHGAEAVQGMEAEDKCGILQWATKDRSSCIVHIDKDVNGVPGHHYNPVKGTSYYVTLAEANEFFWTQVLTGDATDNIRGIKGMGPKTAAKLLAPCNKEWVKMAEVAAREYEKHFGTAGKAEMVETAKLVWILREEGLSYDGSRVDGGAA